MAKIGQIDLFTRRIKKLPAPKENAVHIAVVDTLKKGGLAQGWEVFHPANGELRTDATGALLQRMGVLPGVSDLILFGPPMARLHALELKRKGKKPNDAQKAFLAKVVAAGGLADWADSYDGAMAILRQWGALSDRLHLD